MEKESNIIQTATFLFIKYGIKSVSMDDISRELGISKKTLYSSIKNKQELVQKVIEKWVTEEEKLISSIHKEAKNALDEMLKITQHILLFMRSMKPSLTFDLQKYHRKSWEIIDNQHMDYIEKCIQNNIISGKKDKLYRANINPKIIAKIYVGKSRLISNEDIFPLREFEKVDLFKEMILQHLYGIVSDKGLKLLKKNEDKYVLNAK